jgi:hypothetical protein
LKIVVNDSSEQVVMNCATLAGSLIVRRRGPAFLLAIAYALGLAACSGGGAGGGGGTGDSGLPTMPSVLQVTVSDRFGTAVADATVQGPRGASNTDALGTALLIVDPSQGPANVKVSRTTFVDKTVVAPIAAGKVSTVAVTLEHVRSAAGGSLATRSGVLPAANGTAQQLTFEIELVVVDGDAQPIENLSAANFTLRPCTPDPANGRADCIQAATADAAYTPVTAAPESLQTIPGEPAAPYAAALLMDQSGSILQSDPAGARLFAAKAFIGGLAADDHVLLGAFAGGTGALIPTPPLAVYGPFKDRDSAPAYFPTLDSLLPLAGGNTPLYASLDALRQQSVTDATLPGGLAKAVVIFTDGADTDCAGPAACRIRREQSISSAQADHVRLFTIGLSSGVDIVALGELANRTGGALLYADTAEQLFPLYGSVGKLLSLSLPTYRLRWTVDAGAAGAFQSGDTLLGRVRVTAAAGAFDVPFIVGIP